MKFNPTLKEMLEDGKMTVLGLWWAVTWRVYAIIIVMYMAIVAAVMMMFLVGAAVNI